MTNLYMFTGTDPESFENDRSLVVIADAPEEAFEMWRNSNWQTDADEFATFQGPMLDEVPEGKDYLTLWILTPDLSAKGPLEYHSDACKAIGYFQERTW